MSGIAETIRKMAQGGRPTVSLMCTVDKVYKDTRTVDCTPLDEGAPLLGVNLQANQGSNFGVVSFPRVGSFVVVGFVAEGSAGVVLLTDDVESVEVVVSDKTTRAVLDEDGARIYVGEETSAELTADGVVLNGGKLGGLIKVKDITDKINELIDAFNNHTHTLPTSSVAVSGSATAQTNLSPITVPAITKKHKEVRREDYENEKVKQ